jgi:hypothetical protein
MPGATFSIEFAKAIQAVWILLQLAALSSSSLHRWLSEKFSISPVLQFSAPLFLLFLQIVSWLGVVWGLATGYSTFSRAGGTSQQVPFPLAPLPLCTMKMQPWTLRLESHYDNKYEHWLMIRSSANWTLVYST